MWLLFLCSVKGSALNETSGSPRPFRTLGDEGVEDLGSPTTLLMIKAEHNEHPAAIKAEGHEDVLGPNVATDRAFKNDAWPWLCS